MGDPFDHVRAHPLALEVLRRAVRESRLPSAYLFEGPGGVGKERCALALATAVIGEAAGGSVARYTAPIAPTPSGASMRKRSAKKKPGLKGSTTSVGSGAHGSSSSWCTSGSSTGSVTRASYRVLSPLPVARRSTVVEIPGRGVERSSRLSGASPRSGVLASACPALSVLEPPAVKERAVEAVAP
ncbi:MAG: hypothetical protein KF901_04835 [Myxococcales bacterium]|nr:hypothetical protein [Myxococcales bacterium]